MLLVNLVQTKPVTFSLSISIYATYTFDVSTCELWFGIGTNRTNHNKRDNLKGRRVCNAFVWSLGRISFHLMVIHFWTICASLVHSPPYDVRSIDRVICVVHDCNVIAKQRLYVELWKFTNRNKRKNPRHTSQAFFCTNNHQLSDQPVGFNDYRRILAPVGFLYV